MARDFISPIKGKRCSLSEVLYRLDWIEILREAIEMRRSSWGVTVQLSSGGTQATRFALPC